MSIAPHADHPPNKWLVLAGSGLGVFSLTMNGTAMITAVPAMRHEFDLTPTMLQWIVTIYFLVGAIFLSAAGRLGDRFGHGRVFLAGAFCFMASYVMIAVSPDATTALIGRALQGLAGGLLLPMSLALVRATFLDTERQFAAALWSGVLGLGLGVGPIVGGLLTHFLGWRDIFWVSLVVIGASFVIAIIALRGHLMPPPRAQPKGQDYFGFLLLATSMAALTFAITHAQGVGWSSATTLGTLALSVGALVGLVVRDSRVPAPFLNLNLFRNRRFVAATFGIFSTFFLIYTILVFASIFIQNSLAFGYTPARAGLSLLPLTLLMFVLSTQIHRLIGRFGYRLVVTTGMGLLCTGAVMLHFEVASNGILGFEAALVICGLGLGLTLPVFSGLGVETLPPDQTGQGSGVLTTFTFLGATVGVSVGGLVSMNGARSSLQEALGGVLQPAQLTDIEAGLHTTAASLTEMLGQFDGATAQMVRDALTQAIFDGFADLTLLCAIVAALGATVQCWLLSRHNG